MEQNKNEQDINNNDEDYSLYTETIEKSAFSAIKKYKKLFRLIVKSALMGVIAAIVFILIVRISGVTAIDVDKRQKVTIPLDEYTDKDNNGNTDVNKTDNVAGGDDSAGSDDGNSNEANINQDKTDTGNEATGNNELNENDIANMSQYEYARRLYDKVKKSIVTVNGKDANLDPLACVIEKSIEATGIIIADNEVEYLILTDDTIFLADKITVSFEGGKTVEAKKVMSDRILGMCVVAVDHSEFDKEEQNMIAIATLGNSYMLKNGEFILAYGNILGVDNAIDFGTSISVKEVAYEIDSKHGLIITNILGDENSFGFLFNKQGELVGCIVKKMSTNSIVAYGISDIKLRIQNMSNAKKIAYLGVIGQEISNDFATSSNISSGMFITDIAIGSPAFVAGIQIGDIITSVGGKAITNVSALERVMCELEVGNNVDVIVNRRGKDGYVPITFAVTVLD